MLSELVLSAQKIGSDGAGANVVVDMVLIGEYI